MSYQRVVQMGRVHVHEDKRCTLLHNIAQTTRKQAEVPLDETGIGPGTFLPPNVEIVRKGRTQCPKCAHAELMLIPQEHLRQDLLQRAFRTYGGHQRYAGPSFSEGGTVYRAAPFHLR